MQLRSVVWLFCGSLDRYNLTTRALRAALDGQRDRYMALLLEEGRQDVVAALRNDKLEPLKIDDGLDFARFVGDLKLDAFLHPLQKPQGAGGEDAPRGAAAAKRRGQLAEPVTMIFSSSVPRLMQTAKNFVFDLASFLDLASPNSLQVLLQSLDGFLEKVVKITPNPELLRPNP